LDYYNGDNIVIINNEETPYDDYASLIIREPIGKVFAEALEFVM
jgi:NAD-dependent deacetylase